MFLETFEIWVVFWVKDTEWGADRTFRVFAIQTMADVLFGLSTDSRSKLKKNKFEYCLSKFMILNCDLINIEKIGILIIRKIGTYNELS